MGYMATWSDQKLSRHKQAQSYLSAGGAALGTTALAAAGMKAKPVGALAGKLAGKIEAPALAGGMKANGKTISGVSQARRLRAANVVRNTPGTIGSKAGGLTTASAGVGGVGGFNFAAIQGQEAKRSKMGSGRTGGGSLAPRGSVSKREYTANQKRIMARAYTKDEFKRSLKHDVAGNAAGLAAGAGVLASTKGGRTTLTGPAKLASAVYRGEKAAAKANRAASSRAGLGSSSKNVFGRVKGAASRAKDSFKDTKRAAGRATTAGLVGLNYSVQRSPPDSRWLQPGRYRSSGSKRCRQRPQDQDRPTEKEEPRVEARAEVRSWYSEGDGPSCESVHVRRHGCWCRRWRRRRSRHQGPRG